MKTAEIGTPMPAHSTPPASTAQSPAVALVMPFANPHLLSIFRELQQKRRIDLSLFVFRDLPEHRQSLGWSTPNDAQFVSWNPGPWLALLSACRKSDHVVFLGLLDPKLLMLSVILMCRVFGRRIWIASEGFKHPGKKLPFLVRLLLNSKRLSFLAIGDRSSQDYRTAGLDRPCYYRFGFAEHYRGKLSELSQPDEDVNLPQASMRILCVGQLNDRKNFESVVSALSSIATSHKTELRICGDGPNAAKLRAMSQHLSHNVSVSLLGNCDPKRLDEEFRSADVFVMPSRYDGWGVVLNQAVQYGLPCIVSSGVRAARGHLIEHSKNGFIYDNDDELTAHLAALIEDESLRTRCSHEAKRIARLWSVQNIADRLLQRMCGSAEKIPTGPLQRLAPDTDG